MSTSNTTDTSLPDESNPYTNYSNKPLDNVPKMLKAVGRKRTSQEECSASFLSDRAQSDILVSAEHEADNDEILKEQEIKAIVDMAGKNPVTNEMIEKAKLFTSVNREKIKKQCTDLVAFYNIAHEKPFYFITPAEARMAIDYIKQCRQGYAQGLEEQGRRDIFIREFMKEVVIPGKLESDLNKVMLSLDCNSSDKIQEGVDKIVDKICGIEMGETQGTLDSNWHREHPYDTLEAFAHTLQELQGYNMSEIKDKEQPEQEELPKHFVYNAKEYASGSMQLTLSMINRAFSVLEHCNVTVDVILANSFRIADIRNFGKTVYDEYDKRTFMTRRCFGKLFTAEIYPCNKLANNQIVFGSLNLLPDHGIFLNVLLEDQN